MKFSLWSLILLLLLGVGNGAEEASAELISGFVEHIAAEDAAERLEAKKELLTISNHQLSAVVKAVYQASKKSSDPELRGRAGMFLKTLYRHHELDEGKPFHGMKLGWFIEHDGKSVFSTVLVLDVEADSPAAKAGVEKADVIYQIDGQRLGGTESRNDLVHILGEKKAGTEVVLHIKHGGTNNPIDSYDKNKRKKAKLVLEKSTARKKTAKFKEKLFQAWLTSFEA